MFTFRLFFLQCYTNVEQDMKQLFQLMVQYLNIKISPTMFVLHFWDEVVSHYWFNVDYEVG